jgi:hypothetical protein
MLLSYIYLKALLTQSNNMIFDENDIFTQTVVRDASLNLKESDYEKIYFIVRSDTLVTVLLP